MGGTCGMNEGIEVCAEVWWRDLKERDDLQGLYVYVDIAFDACS